eukprot:12397760-Karenia_brevis.AAC.1
MGCGRIRSPINISIEGAGRELLEKSFSNSELASEYGPYGSDTKAAAIMRIVRQRTEVQEKSIPKKKYAPIRT